MNKTEYAFGVETVTATQLKHRLGEFLDRGSLRKVAIQRHGRVVAYLVPASAPAPMATVKRPRKVRGLSRLHEERLLDLFVSGDFRPSRWKRAGEPGAVAGVLALLASLGAGDRARLFALAEGLRPGISRAASLERWLAEEGLEPGRLLAMLAARRKVAALRHAR